MARAMAGRLVLCLLLGFAAGAARAATPQSPQAIYDDLAARVKAGHTDIDFAKLRHAYAGTAAYNPYLHPAEEKAMVAAFEAKDCAGTRAAGDKILAANLTDIEAHILVSLCALRQGDDAAARFHRAIALGLLDSIARSGDGKKPETAYVVIAVSEEYAFLSTHGDRVTRQALLRSGTHRFDAMSVVDKSGAAKTILFNIDIPAAWLDRKH